MKKHFILKHTTQTSTKKVFRKSEVAQYHTIFAIYVLLHCPEIVLHYIAYLEKQHKFSQNNYAI